MCVGQIAETNRRHDELKAEMTRRFSALEREMDEIKFLAS
jgi:hypothetical protein